MSAAPAAAALPRSRSPREFELGRREFARLTGLLRAETGIDMGEGKRPLVYARLVKRLRALGLDGFRSYCELVERPDSPERAEMLAALTTNVTRFFREAHHFEHLRDHALPTLVERARLGGRVRLWSAACASGEEPYSMAMTVLEAAPDAARRDVRILATDVSGRALDRARAGVYPETALQHVPEASRGRWFAADGDGRRVGPEPRALVSFRPLNLTGGWPMRGPFDVVFCRNVVIYFDGPTQVALWRRLADALAPGGLLYIGHSERVSGPAEAMFESDGVTVYRRLGASR